MSKLQAPPAGRSTLADQQTHQGLEFYDGVRAHGLPGIHQHLLGLAQDMLPKGASVLDLACGAGALSRRLHDAGFRVTASDLDTGKVVLGPEIEFVQADLNGAFSTAIPGQWDGVMASEVIEHLENPRHFLREIRRMLAPGGLLILSTPNVQSPWSKAMFLRHDYSHWFSTADYHESGHISPVSAHQLGLMLDEVGFDLVLSTSIGSVFHRNWPAIYVLARLISAISTAPKGETLVVAARSR